MKERRMAPRCRNCGESMPMDALLCAKCGKATSEIFTRLTDLEIALAALRPSKGGRPQESMPFVEQFYTLCQII